MTRPTLDEQFAAIKACTQDTTNVADQLRPFLNHASNLVVERAVNTIAAEELRQLNPELVATFERLLVKPVKTDPGCIAKTAICAALRGLEYAETEFYKRHVSYTQFEPYFGGLEDKAGALRAECLLALVELRSPGFMEAAVDLSFDPVPAARGGGVRGIANSARPEASVLLRMRALAGDESSDVMGEVLSGLIQTGPDAIAFVGRFLDHDDATIVGEAAFALAESRRPEAVPLIVARWQRDPHGALTQTLFTALALCRHDDSIRALCDIATNKELDLAKHAMTALQQAPNRRLAREILSESLKDCVQSARVRFFEESLVEP